MNDDQIVPSLDIKNLKVMTPLGRGAKGVVFLVQDETKTKNKNGELLALKVISRASITRKLKKKKKKKKDSEDGDEYKRIMFEQEVLQQCEHPLLPKLRGVLSTDDIVGYAIDYCPGRDLNYLRRKQTEKMFSDDFIRFYAAELVLALEYLHGLGIVYRDLKPENVMIQENGHLMLVDFDLSTKLAPKKLSTPSPNQSPTAAPKTLNPVKKHNKNILSKFYYNCCYPTVSGADSVHPAESVTSDPTHNNSYATHSNSKSNSFVGTEEYVSPEMIQGNGHDYALDWWCLGVVLYEMLYGTTPFRGINRKETFYRILSKTPELIGEPNSLRDLIRRLLEKDPTQRISVNEIKGHDFFKNVDWEKVVMISRPPFIPGPLDHNSTDESQMIDIEDFVRGVFKVEDDDVMANVIKEKESNEVKDFLVF